MAKTPDIFSRIRSRVTKAGIKAKFATPKFGARLAGLVPAPPTLLQRLGIKGAFVPAGKRPSIRSTIVTPTMMRKARLESAEGRPLSRVEVTQIHRRRRFIDNYLKRKLRLDPRLDDSSLFPSFWDRDKTFQEQWLADQRRFLRLAEDRTGLHFELDGNTGEWRKIPVAGASRNVMSDADWKFYTRHYYANLDLYETIGPELLELPPGEVSPRTIRAARRPGRANATGRSVGSYQRRRAA